VPGNLFYFGANITNKKYPFPISNGLEKAAKEENNGGVDGVKMFS
jgi:hypothetical protein